MKDLVNDTCRFRSPDGGEITISMIGYPPEKIDRFISSLEGNEWELVDHIRKVKSSTWEVPIWFYPAFLGMLVGMVGVLFLAYGLS